LLSRYKSERGLPLQFCWRILISVVFFVVLFLAISCGLKKPKEEIGPVKEVTSRFERGVVYQNKAVLDSVYGSKGINKDSLISSVLEQFYTLKSSGGLDDLHFARRRFSLIEDKDSVKVELILGGENLKEEKILTVYLKKSRGKWRVVGQSFE
jgi:hypothetical protein